MSRSGRVHVQVNATPTECRAIAEVLERWYRAEFSRLRLAWIDHAALEGLAEGRVPAPAWHRMRALGFAEQVNGRVVPLTDEEAREAFGPDRAVGWAQSYSGDRAEAIRSLRRAVVELEVERVEIE